MTAHSHVRLQFRCLGNRSALTLKPHQKQTYLFRSRSFIAKHGVLLVVIVSLFLLFDVVYRKKTTPVFPPICMMMMIGVLGRVDFNGHFAPIPRHILSTTYIYSSSSPSYPISPSCPVFPYSVLTDQRPSSESSLPVYYREAALKQRQTHWSAAAYKHTNTNTPYKYTIYKHTIQTHREINNTNNTNRIEHCVKSVMYLHLKRVSYG